LAQDIDSPFVEAWNERWRWVWYDRKRIFNDLWRARMFDRPYGLDQVYVPLRAGFRPESGDDDAQRGGEAWWALALGGDKTPETDDNRAPGPRPSQGKTAV